MPDRRLRYRLLVRAHQRSWGWISRTNRLRNRRRSVDQGQQCYRRDQLSHDGSPELGPLSPFMVAGRLDHKVPKPHVSFRCSKRADTPWLGLFSTATVGLVDGIAITSGWYLAPKAHSVQYCPVVNVIAFTACLGESAFESDSDFARLCLGGCRPPGTLVSKCRRRGTA
jgi:hypothetical protein